MSGTWAIDWVKNNLNAIYTATSQSSFDEAFTNFPAKDAHITVNGSTFTHDEYKKYIEQERHLAIAGTIKYLNAVEVPLGSTKTKDGEITLATVGIFFEVKVAKPIGPKNPGVIESIVTSSLNVKVKREFGTVPPPGIGSWLVTTAIALDQVIIEKPEVV